MSRDGASTVNEIANQPACFYADALEDAEILALVDRYVFGQSLWCNGQSQFDEQTGQRRCAICGQIDEGSLADYVGNAGQHPRNVPLYTAATITQTMHAKEIGVAASFDLLVQQADRRNVRAVSIAALRALRRIDRSGHLR